ncbi:MAG: helix-turn-helix transcriptional regulator [Proteobacteria bacterium]|nr:helix-turn-helix transcriptional regulator [Desulfobulbaceae bacterium]MBU4152159.1 helix-turn-helix transcriptional regulator [Pseudomonadota bacterium]
MLEPTKKRPTEERLVSLTLKVHPINVERIKRFVECIEPEADDEGSISAEDFFDKYFPGENKAAIHLRGARGKEGVTQAKLAELTGIPQRHISEMENSKRPIGKENAKKMAKVLHCDYRHFL